METATKYRRDRIYHVAVPQGFPRPAIRAICSGFVLHRDMLEAPTKSGLNCSAVQWRVSDGRLPEFQPRMSFNTACEYVLANPTAFAFACPDTEAH